MNGPEGMRETNFKVEREDLPGHVVWPKFRLEVRDIWLSIRLWPIRLRTRRRTRPTLNCTKRHSVFGEKNKLLRGILVGRCGVCVAPTPSGVFCSSSKRYVCTTAKTC